MTTKGFYYFYLIVVLTIIISTNCLVQVTKHYKSFGNKQFSGPGRCVATTDFSSSVGKRGPFVECMLSCNAQTDCGSFWLIGNNCKTVNKTACTDMLVQRNAAD